MTSTKDNAVYISKITAQQAGEFDWYGVSSAFIETSPVKLQIDENSNDIKNFSSLVSISDGDRLLVKQKTESVSFIAKNITEENINGQNVYKIPIPNNIKDGTGIFTPDKITNNPINTIDPDNFGSSATLSSNGLCMVISSNYDNDGTSYNGTVFSYYRNSTSDDWTYIGSKNLGGNYAGLSTQMTDDGLHLVTDNHNDRTIIDFSRASVTDNWTLKYSYAPGGKFGYGFSMSGDGLNIIMGDVVDNEIVTLSRSNVNDRWSGTKLLNRPDSMTGAYFGKDLSISYNGLHAVVTTNETRVGSVTGLMFSLNRASISDNWTIGDSYSPIPDSDTKTIHLVSDISRDGKTLYVSSAIGIHVSTRNIINNVPTKWVYKYIIDDIPNAILSISGDGKTMTTRKTGDNRVNTHQKELPSIYKPENIELGVSIESDSEKCIVTTSGSGVLLTKVSSTTTSFTGTSPIQYNLNIGDTIELDGVDAKVTYIGYSIDAMTGDTEYSIKFLEAESPPTTLVIKDRVLMLPKLLDNYEMTDGKLKHHFGKIEKKGRFIAYKVISENGVVISDGMTIKMVSAAQSASGD